MDPVLSLDLVIAADFTAGGDMGRRLSQEIRHLAGEGLSIGLLQGATLRDGTAIAPEVQACVRRGLARRVLPDEAGKGAAKLILHGPAGIEFDRLGLPWTGLQDVAVVCHTPQDAAMRLGFGPRVKVRRHAIHGDLRRTAGRRPGPFGRTWLPVAAPLPLPQRAARPVAIGWIGGAPDAGGLEDFDHIALDGSTLSLDRLVAGIDVLVLREAADALVATMLASGRAVVAEPSLRMRYGAGPVYSGDPATGVRMALSHAPQHGQHAAAFVAACRAGPVMKYGKGNRRPAKARARPVLCLSSNGVGIGHLTRLLAIARRIGPEAEIVFATQAQAVGVVESFGYPVEYIPSPGAVQGEFGIWDAWFAAHLGRIVGRYDPALVIYDGNHPSEGLMRAVASRRDCRLAWVRRGMWGKTTSDFMANARWCDLVIEPGELAAERDAGVTAALRDEALQVDPIRLLDPCDLLPRAAAAAALGLNPARPAVLVQLGSGYQRDLLSMLDQIVTELGKVPGLQICVAEWVNGSVPLTLWPDVTVLRGFPVSQYIRAFDFCISAAGYNSFHELIGFEVPTIFVANRHPTMDDQYGRAKFAQDRSAAFEISETDLHELSDLIPLLMQSAAREYLSDRCRLLSRPNGADTAATALLELAGIAPRLALAAE